MQERREITGRKIKKRMEEREERGDRNKEMERTVKTGRPRKMKGQRQKKKIGTDREKKKETERERNRENKRQLASNTKKERGR